MIDTPAAPPHEVQLPLSGFSSSLSSRLMRPVWARRAGLMRSWMVVSPAAYRSRTLAAKCLTMGSSVLSIGSGTSGIAGFLKPCKLLILLS